MGVAIKVDFRGHLSKDEQVDPAKKIPWHTIKNTTWFFWVWYTIWYTMIYTIPKTTTWCTKVNYRGGIPPGNGINIPKKPWYTMVIFTMVFTHTTWYTMVTLPWYTTWYLYIPHGITIPKKPWYTMVIHTIWYTMVTLPMVLPYPKNHDIPW